MIFYRVHMNTQPDPILRRKISNHNVREHIFNLHFNIIISTNMLYKYLCLIRVI